VISPSFQLNRREVVPKGGRHSTEGGRKEMDGTKYVPSGGTKLDGGKSCLRRAMEEDRQEAMDQLKRPGSEDAGGDARGRDDGGACLGRWWWSRGQAKQQAGGWWKERAPGSQPK